MGICTTLLEKGRFLKQAGKTSHKPNKATTHDEPKVRYAKVKYSKRSLCSCGRRSSAVAPQPSQVGIADPFGGRPGGFCDLPAAPLPAAPALPPWLLARARRLVVGAPPRPRPPRPPRVGPPPLPPEPCAGKAGKETVLPGPGIDQGQSLRRLVCCRGFLLPRANSRRTLQPELLRKIGMASSQTQRPEGMTRQWGKIGGRPVQPMHKSKDERGGPLQSGPGVQGFVLSATGRGAEFDTFCT